MSAVRSSAPRQTNCAAPSPCEPTPLPPHVRSRTTASASSACKRGALNSAGHAGATSRSNSVLRRAHQRAQLPRVAGGQRSACCGDQFEVLAAQRLTQHTPLAVFRCEESSVQVGENPARVLVVQQINNEQVQRLPRRQQLHTHCITVEAQQHEPLAVGARLVHPTALRARRSARRDTPAPSRRRC